MRGRRSISIALAVALLAPAAAGADEGVPILEEPVLRSDSAFEQTAWGFKRKDFTLPAEGSNIPVVLTIEGYSGAGVPNAYLRMPDRKLMALRFRPNDGPGGQGPYMRVYASIRGTECSGGVFYLYDQRHAWDSHFIIEWLGTQPWSNGNVGMIGWSFSGQTAYWAAATQPPHLKAVAPSLLHSDIYRDIFMPGGVQNYLFPVAWYLGTPVSGPHRLPTSSLSNGNIPNDEICTQHQVQRAQAGDPPNAFREYLYAAAEGTDNDWYRMHAAQVHAPAIRIPYMQQNNWQDEQTGPRAATLFNYIHPDPVDIKDANCRRNKVIPKKMLFSNGSHGYGGAASRRMWDFFDIFLRGACDTTGLFEDADNDDLPDRMVENFFEIRSDGTYTARKTGETWPFADTDWQRLYARDGGLLSADAPTGSEPSNSYVSGVPTRNWDRSVGAGGFPAATATARNLPDGVVYQSDPIGEDTAIAGPILFEMYASMLGTDTDFFVSLHDVDESGNVSYLQRGLLKASHRDIDPVRSFYANDDDGSRFMFMPYRPHTSPRLVVPNEIVKYDIEIWPLGHIFRAGHSLRIQIHTPPAIDGIWGYTATHQPAVVTVHHDAEHPTNLLLPVVAGLEAGTAAPNTDCRVPGGFACVPGSRF